MSSLQVSNIAERPMQPETPILLGNMEKTPSSSVPTTLDPEVGECVATDPFGRPLVPDPTSDALDPLNWPLGRKYPIIGTVYFAYFMMIYAISAPVPAFPQLQTQFNTSYVKILWTFALANLGSAVGPLLASASADIVGRRTIMIFGTIVSVVGSGVASLHGITYEGYSAARFFQVLGATPAISVGLSIINDLSWEHERGFRVGLWVMSIDLGAYFGPLSRSPALLYMD
jgi:MFS family permease